MNTKNQSDFCVFILTHGRPDKVITYNTLRRDGYTGPIYLVVDNEDSTVEQYQKKFGIDNIIIFDKRETAKTFDEFDNFGDRRTIVYARNECFRIARRLGYKYFLELDDDYVYFAFRLLWLNDKLPTPAGKKSLYFTLVHYNLNGLFSQMFQLLETTKACSIAFSQGGDWMDGTGRGFSRRKCMNTFFCSTDRPFNFIGRINEDVNTYTWYQSIGNLFLTVQWVQMVQHQTQTTAGGMSSIYLNQGTFVKSFYTIICSPSCVKIKIMGSANRRMHHKVNWDAAVPMLISEHHKVGSYKAVPAGPPPKPCARMTVAEINALVKTPLVKQEGPKAIMRPKKRRIKTDEQLLPIKKSTEITTEFVDHFKGVGFYRSPKADIQL